MFRQPGDLSKAISYYSIALALCIGVTLLTPILGPRTPDIAMFIPLVSVLFMLLIVTRDGYSKVGWQLLGIRSAGQAGWGLALLLPFLVLGFAYGTVWLSGLATFAVPEQHASGFSLMFDVFASIAFVALLGGLGEEIGWRGYLLPRLMHLGVWPALLWSGLLHGIWHLPIILWTPFYHGTGNRWIVVPLFVLTLTVAGVCYGYLRLTTTSIWPAAIAHSAFNVYWNHFNAYTISESPNTVEYLAGESGILTLTALIVAASWLMNRFFSLDQSRDSHRPVRDL